MIIDTNVYSKLRRAEPAAVQMLNGSSSVKLPFPIVAELRAGFIHGTLTDRNTQLFTAFLGKPEVTVLSPTVKTMYIYAELQDLCWRRGCTLSNNDIWIAALAREDGDMLVTYDQDFTVFQELFGDKLKVLS